MTQKDKELLLRDLCERLPYGVIVQYNNGQTIEKRELGLGSLHDFMFNDVEIKPYLRPLLSKTEKENREFRARCYTYYEPKVDGVVDLPYGSGYDWLKANHFDYRNLIKKGLALEAPKGMYKTK